MLIHSYQSECLISNLVLFNIQLHNYQFFFFLWGASFPLFRTALKKICLYRHRLAFPSICDLVVGIKDMMVVGSRSVPKEFVALHP